MGVGMRVDYEYIETEEDVAGVVELMLMTTTMLIIIVAMMTRTRRDGLHDASESESRPEETSTSRIDDVGRLLYPDEPGCAELWEILLVLRPLLGPVQREQVRGVVVLIEHFPDGRLGQVTHLEKGRAVSRGGNRKL